LSADIFNGCSFTPAEQQPPAPLPADDWSNKKVFPEHLRPIIHRLVEAAIGVDWYGQDFFDLSVTLLSPSGQVNPLVD
jgi:hypothetical protein